MLKSSFTRVFFLLALFAVPSVTPLAQRDQNAEDVFIEELRKISAESVPTFVAATEALDSEQYPEAERLYLDVLKKAPDFEPALRRLGYTYVAQGKRTEGQQMTQKALSKNRSVENLVGRASSLISSPSDQPSQPEVAEALSLGREAWHKSGKADEGSARIIADALLMLNRSEEFIKFADELRKSLPGSAVGAYYGAIGMAESGDLDGAEAEIKRGVELGIPPEAAQTFLDAIATARDEAFFGLGRYRTYFYIAFALAGVWAVGLFGLFIAGRSLSKKTLRSIEESDPNDVTGEAQASLKKLYRRVVSIAGAYYYLSQPFVVFLVVAFTGAVILGFMWIGRIPVQIVLVLAFVGAASIFYMIKSLVTRVKVEDPGRALTEAEAPKLWALVRSVAATVQTRPVTEIRITEGTDLAVYERGSFREKLSDGADRILILGAATFNGFDQNAFRAVLAHEYGHFSNRDTAGGDVAHRVNTDIARVAEGMIESGTATFYNLSFQFLKLFHFLFRRITYGASRLQEILADRVAAYHFGADAFKEGLRHVIRRELEFGHVVEKEVNAALGANRPIANLYDLSVQDDAAKGEIEAELERVLEMPTSADDTHPSPGDRFRFTKNIRSARAEVLSGDVWDLFADRNAISTEMNTVIEQLVRSSYELSDVGVPSAS